MMDCDLATSLYSDQYDYQLLTPSQKIIRQEIDPLRRQPT